MAIKFSCVCGKAYSVADDYAGKQGRCSQCKRLMQIPLSTSDCDVFPPTRDDFPPPLPAESSPRLPVTFTPSNSVATAKSMVQVTGKPAIFVGGGIMPAWFGRTTMTLLSDRVHSTTRRLLNREDATFVLGHIEAISITSRVNWLWFVLAILTLPFFGLGLVFLLVFLLLRERFIVIYGSGSHCVGLTMQGDDSPYVMFRDSILASIKQ